MPAPTASEPLRHLLVPDAAPLPGVSADLPPLPNLAALLARLRVEHTLAPDADSPAMPVLRIHVEVDAATVPPLLTLAPSRSPLSGDVVSMATVHRRNRSTPSPSSR